MCFGNTFSLPILATFSAFHLISDRRQYGGLACILQSCLAIWCPAPSHKLLSMPPYHPFKHFLSWRRWRKVQRSHHRNLSGSINAIRKEVAQLQKGKSNDCTQPPLHWIGDLACHMCRIFLDKIKSVDHELLWPAAIIQLSLWLDDFVPVMSLNVSSCPLSLLSYNWENL